MDRCLYYISVSPSEPTELAAEVAFIDIDNDPWRVQGTVTITPPAAIVDRSERSGGQVEGYSLWWGSSATTKLRLIKNIAKSVGTSPMTVEISKSTPIGSTLTWLLVYSFTHEGILSTTATGLQISDASGQSATHFLADRENHFLDGLSCCRTDSCSAASAAATHSGYSFMAA
eukprot:GHVU01090873.1.p2 GENE.GHVU01090873.1~~GHVU01090873.1.p2  ORF type:complete len:173 (+),score=14.13 GHVU01090873.1:2054-2572(+)